MEIEQIFTWPPTPAKWSGLKALIRSLVIIPGRNITLSKSSLGQLIAAKNPNLQPLDPICQFGEIILDSESAVLIRGGLILCGDKNFNVEDWALPGSLSDGGQVIYISIPCESNMDDDGELILPGVKTSSLSAISSAEWAVDAYYPDNTNPTIAAVGVGNFIFPIGSITVSDGIPQNFTPSGCGPCHVDQCGGVLTHTRG